MTMSCSALIKRFVEYILEPEERGSMGVWAEAGDYESHELC